MESIQYIGEHLLPGKVGHFLILLGFTAALVSCISYFAATRRISQPDGKSWRNLGRFSLLIHSFSILAVIGILFYVMIRQYYEYNYVWTHVDKNLPFRYIFAAFWEGQEGSFLLWLFWHIVLALILMLRAGSWESPVLGTLTAVQTLVTSMLLGLYIHAGGSEIKVGINPFILFRDLQDIPLLHRADYLKVLPNTAIGLNALLQNYWMTIHPPTLFLGFASVTVPFAYAMAGLITGQHQKWLRPALPWSLFSACILGTGILMGGAWAYEALSFGGYWAWDPVENMSLVPWLVLLAGLHAHLMAQHTGYSLRATYLFYLLSFLLVVYSTFLTRSGILGDSSVHAFTQMGLEWQLVLFLVLSIAGALVLYFRKYSSIPVPSREEEINSREFWMFIGALVLMFSSVLITFTTSIPVFNKLTDLIGWIMGKDLSGYHRMSPVDVVGHHNKYQIWIAIFISLLSGLSLYLRYGSQHPEGYRGTWIRHAIIACVLSIGLTLLTNWWIGSPAWQIWLLLFAASFALVTSLDYFLNFLNRNLKVAGAVFSHAGFGILLIGIVASGVNKRFISVNSFAQAGVLSELPEEEQKKNILLLRNKPIFMSGYEVTYLSDSLEGYERSYRVRFARLNREGKAVDSFEVKPNLLYKKDFSNIAALNPSTKRYLHKDIFTALTSIPQEQADPSYAQKLEDSLDYRLFTLLPGKPLETEKHQFRLDSLSEHPSHPDYEKQVGDLAIAAFVSATSRKTGETVQHQTILVLRGNLVYTFPAKYDGFGVRLKLPEAALQALIDQEESLPYREFRLKQGESTQLGDLQIRFQNFNKKPRHPGLEPDSVDLAVGAVLDVRNLKTGKTYAAEPVFCIRGNSTFQLKDEVREEQLHIRFPAIHPQEESISLQMAIGRGAAGMPVLITENAPHSDFIVLQAIEFPGINLVWLGSLLMMAGLFLAMLNRRKIAKRT